MAADSRADGRKRAALAVAARRGGLGMDRAELAAAAKIDPKTVYNLEIRHRWPIAVTRAKIEEALRWPSGEMERIASEVPEEEPEMPTPEELERLKDHMREVLRGRSSALEEAMDRALSEPPRRGAGDVAAVPEPRRDRRTS
jgi:hypothetical protein